MSLASSSLPHVRRFFGLVFAFVLSVGALGWGSGCASSTPSPTCDSTCSGCCDGTTCVTIPDETACGVGGNMCQKCRSNEKCSDGICVTTQCNGCVDSTSKACVTGNTDTQCGAAGGTCTKCVTGTSCKNGVCVSSACMGCMDAMGKCQPGTTDALCGAGAAACKACTGGQKCDDKHCVAPSTCSPTTCPTGCCDDSDKCQTTSTEEHCGNTGGRCATCSGTQNCTTDGVCKGPCMETCAGCCDSTGACLASLKENCGKPGTDCAACGADEICSEGSCIAMSCKQSCPGCCTGSTCSLGNTATACGSAGNACVACGPMQACVSGACRVDPASTWDLVLVSATTTALNPDGLEWDGSFGPPDPYVKVTLDYGGSAQVTSNTPSVDNTIYPVWMNSTAVANRTASLLMKLTYIELFDYDPIGSDQTMGLCSYMFSNAEFDSTLREIICPGTGPLKWRLQFKLVPHT